MTKKIQSICDKLSKSAVNNAISFDDIDPELTISDKSQIIKYLDDVDITVVVQNKSDLKDLPEYKNIVLIEPKPDVYTKVIKISSNKDEQESDIYNNDTLNWYIKIINRKYGKTLLTKDEEYYYLQEAKCGNTDATEMLLCKNFYLVLDIAIKYYKSLNDNKYVELMDLIQYGNIGLICAINKFDLSKNVKFSTYAVYWVKQLIIRSLASEKLIRIPFLYNEQCRILLKTRYKLEKDLNRIPTFEEIRDYVNKNKLVVIHPKRKNLTLTEVENLFNYIPMSTITSIYQPTNDDDDKSPICIIDIIKDEESVNRVTDNIEQKELKIIIQDLLNKYLKPIEIELILRRFGFYNNKEQTYMEISNALNKMYSHEGVRLKIDRCIRKLKENAEVRNKLEAFYYN